MLRTITTLFALSLALLLASGVIAADSERQQLLQQIEALDSRFEADPNRILAEAIELQQVAIDNRWLDVEAAAVARQSKVFAQMERFDQAQQVIAPFLEREDLAIDIVSRSYLVATQLYVSSFYNDRREFRHWTNKAKALFPELEAKNKLLVKGELLLEISNDLIYFEQFEQALEPAQQAMELFQAEQDRRLINGARAVLANIYSRLGHHQLAIDTYQQILASTEQDKNDAERAISLYNLGTAYAQVPDVEKSQHYLLLSRQLSEQVGDLAGVAYVDLILARQSLEMEQYQQGLVFADDAAALLQPSPQNLNFVTVNGMRIKALIGLDRIDEAEQLLQQISEYKPEQSRVQRQINLLELTHEVRLAQKQYQQALEAYQQASQLKISRLSQEKDNALQAQLAEFGAEQAIAENRILEQTSQLKQAKLEDSQKQLVILYLLLACGVILVGFVSWVLYREKRVREEMERLAMQDFLTGAPNRRAVINYAHKSLSNCIRNQQPFSVAVIDLDRFKRLNDEYGHDVGDKVLKVFSQLCMEELRTGDHFGRIGGEEWLLVLPYTEVSKIRPIFERIQARLQQTRLVEINPPFNLSFSMGAAQWHPGLDGLEDLIKLADTQVYHAKNQGRARLMVAEVVEQSEALPKAG